MTRGREIVKLKCDLGRVKVCPNISKQTIKKDT
jgi:hypothetical protein